MHHKKQTSNEQAFAWSVDSETVASIKTVNNGADCNCVCLSCRLPVYAKQGKKKSWHFAHAKSGACAATAESCLHLAAKEIIRCERRLTVPPTPQPGGLSANPFKRLTTTWARSDLVRFQQVLIERECELLPFPPQTFIPDATGVDENGEALFIEIYVTHEVDAEKRLKISDHGRPALEIDLSKYDRDLNDLNELKRLILDERGNKTWIIPIMDDDPAITVATQDDDAPPPRLLPQFSQSFHCFGSIPISARAYSGFMTLRFPYHDYLNRYVACIGGVWDRKYKTWRLPLEKEGLLLGFLYPGVKAPENRIIR